MTNVSNMVRFLICNYDNGKQKILKIEKATYNLEVDNEGNFVNTFDFYCNEATEKQIDKYNKFERTYNIKT